MTRWRSAGTLLGFGRREPDPVAELQLWALSQRSSRPIVDLEPYETCRVAGIVQRLRLDPPEGIVEVVVGDGTAVTSALWPIRRPTPQLALVPGRAVVLTGVTRVGACGDTVFHEPSFEIVSSDEDVAA